MKLARKIYFANKEEFWNCIRNQSILSVAYVDNDFNVVHTELVDTIESISILSSKEVEIRQATDGHKLKSYIHINLI